MSRIEHIAEGVTLYLGDCREHATKQQDLFIEKPKPVKQEAML